MPDSTAETDPCPESDAPRRCPRCGETKTVKDFHKDRQRKDGIRLYCRECNNTALAARVAREPEKYRALGARNAYKHLLRTQYGMTPHDYALMNDAQGGRCLICGNPESRRGRGGELKPLSVDHCHTTGKVRGLLCDACNKGIGCFKDDITRLSAAIDYLRSHIEEGGSHQS